MSNLTTKMNLIDIEINSNVHFFQLWDDETFWNFTNCLNGENEYTSDENTQWNYFPSISNLRVFFFQI